MKPLPPTIPKITHELYEQLKRIEPSRERDGSIEYYPCKLILRDGRVIDHAYVTEASSHINVWGLWPLEDSQKKSVSLDEVAQIGESPYRIPAHLANKMYAVGESGMGYCIFTLIFSDGRRLPCAKGGAVDFPKLPPGITKDMIVDLIPHEGREALAAQWHDPNSIVEYYWCLYRK
jgi:hypothetical protein